MLFNPNSAQTHKIPPNHDKIAYLLFLWTTLLLIECSSSGEDVSVNAVVIQRN